MPPTTAPVLMRTPSSVDEMLVVEEVLKQSAAEPRRLSLDPCPDGWTLETIVVQKVEMTSTLGITLTNRSDSEEEPVVLSIAAGGAAATPEHQISGTLMPGDRIISISGSRNVLRTDWRHDCDATAEATVGMLKRAASSVVNVRIKRDGVEALVPVEKASKDASLGLGIESNAAWLHPVVREVDPGPCTGKLKAGDEIVSIEAASTVAKIYTRHAKSPKTCTAFLKELVGPITLTIHRLADPAKREAVVTAMTAEATGDEEVVASKIINMARMKLWRERASSTVRPSCCPPRSEQQACLA